MKSILIRLTDEQAAALCLAAAEWAVQAPQRYPDLVTARRLIATRDAVGAINDALSNRKKIAGQAGRN